ncbi:hypothetical protein N7445_005976 [Penicillium cf. griseofulvum]|nr:hypothetical protein N7445_005976 [Penicillium cf. griseofulvum]
MSTVSGLRRLFRRFLDLTSLSLPDIQKILGLTLVVDDEFDSVAPISIPEDLRVWLEKPDRAHGASYTNEASIRCKLNLLLVCAHDLVSSSATQSATLLNIQMERTWAYSPVEWMETSWVLLGRPDYGIWYGEKEDLDLNVIIIEAKRPCSGTEGILQALAYMGCVHKKRKDLGKTGTTVYGISTDAMNFSFMKLDNESRISWSFKLIGVVGNGFEQVLGLLVYLMKKAASMSPATSKRTSRRTQQGSGESDLIFNYGPNMDYEMDDEIDAE